MPPRRKKSPERPVTSKALESCRPRVNTMKEKTTSLALPGVAPHSVQRVAFASNLFSMKTQESGDARISLKTLLNAIKTMEGRLEGKIDVLAARPLINNESTSVFKRNSVSENHQLNLSDILQQRKV